MTYAFVYVHFSGHIHSLGFAWHAKAADWRSHWSSGSRDRGHDKYSTNHVFQFPTNPHWPQSRNNLLNHSFISLVGIHIGHSSCILLPGNLSLYQREISNGTWMRADNLQRQRIVESLQNFEAVKYFTNESYESLKYNSAVLPDAADNRGTENLSVANCSSLYSQRWALIVLHHLYLDDFGWADARCWGCTDGISGSNIWDHVLPREILQVRLDCKSQGMTLGLLVVFAVFVMGIWEVNYTTARLPFRKDWQGIRGIFSPKSEE